MNPPTHQFFECSWTKPEDAPLISSPAFKYICDNSLTVLALRSLFMSLTKIMLTGFTEAQCWGSDFKLKYCQANMCLSVFRSVTCGVLVYPVAISAPNYGKLSLRHFHANRGCLCCLPFIQGHLRTHPLNLQMKRGALQPVMASQVALPWWALIFVTAVGRNAHIQGCEDHIKWGVGPGVEVWTAVCGRAQGSTHLQINGLVLRPKIQPFPQQQTHMLSHTNHIDTHLRATAGMPEETLLSAPSSVSCLSAGGHEGSLSLMSLFVLFQSAASSDGGEYH